MKMRDFGKLGIKGSAFGFGCMRFPTKEVDGKRVIDEELSIRMIRTAIDNGCNYIDTAYVYFDQESERVVGKALKDGYREKVYLATKLPVWMCHSYEDLEKFYKKQCENLDVEHIDFYLLHSMNLGSWENAKKIGAREFMTKLKEEGKISYACFSFHDGYEAFETILNDYDWDMCQIQFNYMDVYHQAGLKGLELAGSKGIPVVIMEGLLGGTLANVPDNVQKLFDEFPVKRTPVEWAFRWICNHPEVATVLSGVSNMDQTRDNLRIFDTVEPGIMSDAELELIEKVREAFESRRKIGCTGCRYCMPCPNGVDIPRIFRTWNDAFKFRNDLKGDHGYRRIVADGCDATKCVECGACEGICPQKLPIIEKLRQAKSEME